MLDKSTLLVVSAEAGMDPVAIKVWKLGSPPNLLTNWFSWVCEIWEAMVARFCVAS